MSRWLRCAAIYGGKLSVLTKSQWFRGNLHTHTTDSDGDAEPAVVVRWYRRHGYDFLVLSDHNHLTILDYASGKRRFRRPLMIPGEEVSVNAGTGAIPVHLNGIPGKVSPGESSIGPSTSDAGQVVPTIQANVDAIIDAGGIASINHPNYKWAFDHKVIRQVRGASLLEVFNGHPAVNVYGAPGKFSYEEIWDGVLSAGRAIYGVATDDSHRYHDFAPELSNPGRGWVVVRAQELSKEAIVDALASGEFYSYGGQTGPSGDIHRRGLPED